MLEDWTASLRTAARSLWRDRGFSAAAIATLGLGLTLCAAMLVVLNAYVLRALPYPAAERLVSIRYAPPGGEPPRALESLDWRALDDVIEHPIAWDLDVFYLIGAEHAESVPGAWVTPGFAQGLGLRPALGRGFDALAFVAGGPQEALISDRLWRGRFGGDPGVLGRSFQAYVSDRPDEAEAFTIVGVLPRDFWHLNRYTEILTPLRAPSYPYLARLRQGVTKAAAAARISALVRAGSPRLPSDWRAEVVSTHEAYVAGLRPLLRAVALAVVLVLLIAWANVAGLLLIRAARRSREIAVRVALGAGRADVARLVLSEVVLLAAGATALGTLLAGQLIRALASPLERQLGRSAPGGVAAFTVDGSVVAWAGAAGLLTAVACALAPLWACWRLEPSRTLQAAGRGASATRASLRMRSALIALEVAASLSLLAASALMVESAFRWLRVDLGWRAERVLNASLTLRQRSYPDAAARLAFYERTLARLAALPGVETVALTNAWPLQQPRTRTLEAERGEGRVAVAAAVATVTPRYFETLSIPLLAGRGFTPADRGESATVAVVSETLARRLGAGASPIGARIRLQPSADAHDAGPGLGVLQVVGVARDVRQSPGDVDLADLYLPLLQQPGRFAFLQLRSAGPPAAWVPSVRTALGEIDANVAIDTARPLQVPLDELIAQPRFLALTLAGFALVAASLALVGVYGVISYAVRQREREIAVRLAVGASPQAITRLFLRQGGVVMAAGLALGLLGAAAAGRAIESQLFGVRPLEAHTLAVAVAGFAAAGLGAIWWPARRAAATDPSRALKEE